jgi:hypothetical protein
VTYLSLCDGLGEVLTTSLFYLWMLKRELTD